MKSRGANRSGLIFGILFLLLGGLILYQSQFIADFVRAETFQPTAAVEKLATDTTMTSRAKRYFFASAPALEPRQSFSRHCQQVEKTTNVLGCYDGRSIYIFDVDNPELDGIEEVTAAHEMLHAGYDRLSQAELDRVRPLLLDQMNQLKSDKKFTERMEAYGSLSEDEKLNELHSIFGTEIRDLSDGLEDYYAQYFANRSKVVDLYEQYSGVFDKLIERAEQLVAELDRRAGQINNRSANYTSAQSQLASDIERFNDRARSGGFASRYEFDIERSQLESRQIALSHKYDSIQASIGEYDRLKSEYDRIASHLVELNNSIDSSLEPVPKV